MSATGYISAHAFASNAQIPLKDVAVSITDSQGKRIAMRLTDRSGFIEPIPISVPDLSAGLTPDTGVKPFSTVNMSARLENYERIEAENIQVFPNVITLQNLMMIPLSELPGSRNKSETFNTPPQNL